VKGFYPESPEDVADRIRKALHVSPADKLTVTPTVRRPRRLRAPRGAGRTSHRLVNTILIDALERRAADIHRGPYEHVFRLRLRLDGILHETRTLPRRLEPPVISRLTIMASLDITERRLPQDGRIRLRYPGREADLRVSILPTAFGEKP
jgi:type II secretory ATPase GspE/PulE/Tfp pilus assembly ATPase PilB-like protein